MDTVMLQNWLSLFATAELIGAHVVTGIRALAHAHLTPEENAEVLAQWEDNVARSARNAGLPPA